MTHQSIADSGLQYWNSSQFDRNNRASALQTALTDYTNTDHENPITVIPSDLEAEIWHRQVGNYHLADWRYRNVSTSSKISSSNTRSLNLVVVSEGEVSLQANNQEVTLTEGDFWIYDPLASGGLGVNNHAQLLSIVMPSQSIISSEAWEQLNGVMISQKPKGTQAILSNHITTLFQQLQFLSGPELTDLLQPTTHLITSAVTSDKAFPQFHRTQKSLISVKKYISENINNSELTPTLIANQHGISTRHLHTLFKHEGESVSNRIKSLRIEGCKSDFSRETDARLYISDIAYKWGFNDLSTFYRLFKRYTGMSPREYIDKQKNF